MVGIFNIALVPKDPGIAYACTELAQSNLKEQASGYLLGESAYPHITLSQFITQSGRVPEVWAQVKTIVPEPLAITFQHIFLRPGVGLHAGKYWVGLSVGPSAILVERQKLVFDALKQLGIEGLQNPHNYFPHLTWSRIEEGEPATISVYPNDEFWRNQHSFFLSIGRSSGNGEYLERLHST